MWGHVEGTRKPRTEARQTPPFPSGDQEPSPASPSLHFGRFSPTQQTSDMRAETEAGGPGPARGGGWPLAPAFWAICNVTA